MSKEIKMIGGFLIVVAIALLTWYGAIRQKATDKTQIVTGQQQGASLAVTAIV